MFQTFVIRVALPATWTCSSPSALCLTLNSSWPPYTGFTWVPSSSSTRPWAEDGRPYKSLAGRRPGTKIKEDSSRAKPERERQPLLLPDVAVIFANLLYSDHR